MCTHLRNIGKHIRRTNMAHRLTNHKAVYTLLWLLISLCSIFIFDIFLAPPVSAALRRGGANSPTRGAHAWRGKNSDIIFPPGKFISKGGNASILADQIQNLGSKKRERNSSSVGNVISRSQYGQTFPIRGVFPPSPISGGMTSWISSPIKIRDKPSIGRYEGAGKYKSWKNDEYISKNDKNANENGEIIIEDNGIFQRKIETTGVSSGKIVHIAVTDGAKKGENMINREENDTNINELEIGKLFKKEYPPFEKSLRNSISSPSSSAISPTISWDTSSSGRGLWSGNLSLEEEVNEVCSAAGIMDISSLIPDSDIVGGASGDAEAWVTDWLGGGDGIMLYLNGEMSGEEYFYSVGVATTPAAILGLIIFLIYIFLWCPQIYFKSARKCFFCCKLRQRDAGVHKSGLFVLFVFLLGASLVAISCVAIFYTVETTGGLRSVHCHVYDFVHDLVSGVSNGEKNEQEEKFIGIQGATDGLAQIQADLQNVPLQVSLLLNESMQFATKVDKFEGGVDLLLSAVSHPNNDPVRYAHQSVFCEYGKEPIKSAQAMVQKGIVPSIYRLREMVQAELSPDSDNLKAIQAALDEQLEVIDADGYVDWIVDGLTSYKQTVYSAILTVEIVLYAASIPVVVFVVLVFIWLFALIFLRKTSSASSVPPCIFWNIFCIYAFAGLIFGGALLVLFTPVTEVCNYVQTDLIEEDKWGEFVSDYAEGMPVMLAETCLAEEGDGDLIRALGLKNGLDFQKNLDESIVELEDIILDYHLNISVLDELLVAAQQFAWLYLPNVGESTDIGVGNGDDASNDTSIIAEDPQLEISRSKLPTYAEVLMSGVQNEAVTITDPFVLERVNGTDKLFGVEKVQEKIFPFHFFSLTGVANETSITEDFDYEMETNDVIRVVNESLFEENINRILKEVYSLPSYDGGNASSASFYESDASASVALLQAQQTAGLESLLWYNALYWAAQKENIRSKAEFQCPYMVFANSTELVGLFGEGANLLRRLNDSDVSIYEISYRQCAWEEFSPFLYFDDKSSHILNICSDLRIQGVEFVTQVDLMAVSFPGKLLGIVDSLLEKIYVLLNSLNCSFLRNSTIGFVDTVCTHTVLPFLMLSLSWILAGVIATLVAFILILAWRHFLDNKILRRKS